MMKTIRELALVAATTELDQLRGRISQLQRLFPQLRTIKGRDARGPARRRRSWNDAQRKQAAARMRKYWAARRKEKVRG